MQTLYIYLFSYLILTPPPGRPQSHSHPADVVKVTRPRVCTAREHGQGLLQLPLWLCNLPPRHPSHCPYILYSDFHTQRWVWQKRTSWPKEKFSFSKAKTSGGFHLISKLLFLLAIGGLWQRKCCDQPMRTPRGAPAGPLALSLWETFHLISSSAKVGRSGPSSCSQDIPARAHMQLFGPV